MASAKQKKTKTAAVNTLSQTAPQTTGVPPQPIPDFDPGIFLAMSDEMDMSGKALQKLLAGIFALCDQTKKVGALQALANSESAARMSGTLAEAEALAKQFVSVVTRFRAGMGQWKAGERRSRRARFERLAGAMQWKLTGSWPEPVIEGIVFVVVDDHKDRATVNGHSLTSPTAERIVAQVASDLNELTANRTPTAEFGVALWHAYKLCGGVPGTGVLVYDLLSELTWQRQSKPFHRDPRQELFRGYSLAQFRADLTHYLSTGPAPIVEGGKSLELEIVGGSFAQDGMFMYFPQSDRLATCGRVTFKLAERGGDL